MLAIVGLIIGFSIVVWQVQGADARSRAVDGRVTALQLYNTQLGAFDASVSIYNKCLASVDTRSTLRDAFHKIDQGLRLAANGNEGLIALANGIDALIDANYAPLTVAGGSNPNDPGCGKMPVAPEVPAVLRNRIAVTPSSGSTPATAVLVTP